MIKGIVFVGSTVTTELSASQNNTSSALLFIGHGIPGPTPLTDSDTVAPGARSRRLSVVAQAEGLIRVFVDMESSSESGQLAVSIDSQDPPTFDEPVSGSTTWLFAVIEKPSNDD